MSSILKAIAFYQVLPRCYVRQAWVRDLGYAAFVQHFLPMLSCVSCIFAAKHRRNGKWNCTRDCEPDRGCPATKLKCHPFRKYSDNKPSWQCADFSQCTNFTTSSPAIRIQFVRCFWTPRDSSSSCDQVRAADKSKTTWRSAIPSWIQEHSTTRKCKFSILQ